MQISATKETDGRFRFSFHAQSSGQGLMEVTLSKGEVNSLLSLLNAVYQDMYPGPEEITCRTVRDQE